FVCDEGYVIKGSQVMKCLKKLKWKFDMPSCKAITCPDLVLPDNLVIVKGSTTTNIYGNTIVFACDDDMYKLVGESTMTCTGNGPKGIWSSQLPSCKEKACLGDYNCSIHGECVGGQCECDQGWLGRQCTEPDCSQQNNCYDHGACIKPNVCKCRAGWSGESCEINQCLKNHHTCQTCVEDYACGWSGGPNPECFPGDPTQPDTTLVAGPWFYWNCVTIEKSTGCSPEIKAAPCSERCDNTKDTYKGMFCQQCRDFEKCFNMDTNFASLTINISITYSEHINFDKR
ncbi:unnamed protein product, partial [Owenia fusiformis]